MPDSASIPAVSPGAPASSLAHNQRRNMRDSRCSRRLRNAPQRSDSAIISTAIISMATGQPDAPTASGTPRRRTSFPDSCRRLHAVSPAVPRAGQLIDTKAVLAISMVEATVPATINRTNNARFAYRGIPLLAQTSQSLRQCQDRR